MSNMKNITITDVAKDAGVSIKTVSRVINQEKEVAAITREKVLKSIKKLDFKPNKDARGLRSKKSFLIGIVYDNPNKYYLSDIQSGALKACAGTNYNIVLQECKYKSKDINHVIGKFISNAGLNGIVLTPPLSDNAKLLDYLEKQNIFVSLIAPPTLSKFELWASGNDEEAAMAMTNKIIALGHKKIGFVYGHKDHSASHQRYYGFHKALMEADIAINQNWIFKGDFSFDSGYKAAQSLFKLRSRPSALFCSNDSMAAGVIKYAYQNNKSIPKDLSITGFDDSMIAEEIWPSLTTVRQPVEAMAKHAIECIISKIDPMSHKVPFSKVFPAEIITRESLIKRT